MSLLKKQQIPLKKRTLKLLDTTITDVVAAKSSLDQFIDPKASNNSIVKRQIVDSDSANNLEVAILEQAPIMESQVTFTIPATEIQRLQDGDAGADLSNLEMAIDQVIQSEESLFYQGLAKPEIPGLLDSLATPTFTLKPSGKDIIAGILKGAVTLRSNYIVGPYSLVVGLDFLSLTAEIIGDKVLAALIEEEIESELIVTDAFSGALLVPTNSDNLVIDRLKNREVSYLYRDGENYHFKVRNSFSYQLLNDKSAIYFKLA